MKPNKNFIQESFARYREFLEFWSFIRYASEKLGYSPKSRSKTKSRSNKKVLKRYSKNEIILLAKQQNLSEFLVNKAYEYLNYRAEILENHSKLLMNKEEARDKFTDLVKKYKINLDPENSQVPLPLNKQKGDKRHFAYFSCIVNILTYSVKRKNFEGAPKKLVVIKDENNKLVMTLSRRIDGAYPNLDTPIAIWEIKEFYSTTTFGSRVADGIYETSLDGYELKEILPFLNKKIEHYLLIDGYSTWWEQGRSYLCRLVDILHIGLVDEVIFGSEVFDRWPQIVSKWP